MRYVRVLGRFVLAHWKAALAVLAGLAATGAAGAVMVAWLGLYNVAASEGHWYIIEQFLRFGMENSVEARKPDSEPPDLDDPDLIRLGAGHYYAGCAYCHGAPGQPITPVSAHMLPAPPDLAEHARLWTSEELFWIIKHGLKYTGMPAWPTQVRDDEVWALVAFTHKLPDLDERTYRDLALGRVEIPPRAAQEIATGSGSSDAVDACARCHGAEAGGPLSNQVPRLHGQTADMLMTALRQFKTGERPSGIMQTAVAGIEDAELQRLADYYASLPDLPPLEVPPDAGDIAAGRELALHGDPAREIPACTGCHSSQALPLYPRLAGQSLPYMRTRLHGFRSGIYSGTPKGRIMTPIAQSLTDRDIANVTAFFASWDESAGTGVAR